LFAESRPESVESERAMNAILTADVDRLERELAKARRTAEYWKAEHLAGNEQIDAARAEAEALRHDMERQADTLAELATENEALRKDAERYRYARCWDLIGRLGRDPIGDCYCGFDSIDDDAIDAAIAKDQP
jgi:uncharacterized ferredoxin-like protein